MGVWRFFDLFQRLKIHPTLSINARVCEDYLRVAQQARDDGWEFMGHSYEQGPIHKEPDQAAMIARSMGILEKFTGKRPVGWLGPGLTQTYETPELLVDAGVLLGEGAADVPDRPRLLADIDREQARPLQRVVDQPADGGRQPLLFQVDRVARSNLPRLLFGEPFALADDD